MPNKFQPIDFQDLDDLFAFLPEDELKMVQSLRQLVYDCIPEVKEKLSYNVPFFRVKQTICYIWPGSVPWGNSSPGRVSIGFYKGHLLEDDGYLEAGKKKVIKSKSFTSLQEIDFEILRGLLFHALELDKA